MGVNFRASMNWLHTWAGVVMGGLLLAIFWMGTLSVFDREIDRWMMPMTRLASVDSVVSFDALHRSLEAAVQARSPLWRVILPTEREPFVRVVQQGASGPVYQLFDPASGAALPAPGTWAGTGFIYPFHYMLHLKIGQAGIWIVGLAGMVMLALCVSGVVIHRRLFVDFFTVRRSAKPRRLVLDLHNVAGVAALPFHVGITLSGLVIFFAIYFPGGLQMAFGDWRAFEAEAYGSFARPRLGEPGAGLASLDAMAAAARASWNGEAPRDLIVRHPGDKAVYVQVRRAYDGQVVAEGDMAWFDGATGALLHHRSSLQPVMTSYRFIAGLHLIQFRHWTLRWIYFALGLAGCLVIATGYLFWLQSRRRKHGQIGVRIVESLAIGSVTGLVVATFAFFVANRLLPAGAAFAGYDRAALEIWIFYLAWLGTFGHGWRRRAAAWAEQCWIIAALAGAAVLLNWLTTGDHLLRSLAHRHLWPVAGMDAVLLLAGAAVLWWPLRRAGRARMASDVRRHQ